MKTFLKELKWMVTISVVGTWFGFWHYVGWDTARTLTPIILIALKR